MNFFHYICYNCPQRKIREDIGNISKEIFGYDILSKPYLKDVDDRCSYFKIQIEYIPKTGTDLMIMYSPLYVSPLQERHYNEFISRVRSYVKSIKKK